MYIIWLAGLILGSGYAILGGGETKWRLLNAVIILSCMGLGYGIGYAAGLGSGNLGSVPEAGLPLSLLLGTAAAVGCVGWNSQRGK